MLRVAINGYGRIGRSALRAFYELGYRDRAEVVAVNDIAAADARIRLTNLDSEHGKFALTAELDGGCMRIVDDRISMLSEPDIGLLPWRSIGVDIVFDCTGLIHDRNGITRHLDAGAGRVLLSYPGPADVDLTVVYGINHERLGPEHRMVSNASCTSNCAVPALYIMDDAFGIAYGSLAVIHSVMNDQPQTDTYHHHDPHRERSGIGSIVPIDTALAQGIARVLPHLRSRISASAVRVPVLTVSAMEFSLITDMDTTVDRVNEVIEASCVKDLAGIVGIEHAPLVSVDFRNDRRSCIIDGSRTQVTSGRLVKLLAWFDTEWAYAARMWDTAFWMAGMKDK